MAAIRSIADHTEIERWGNESFMARPNPLPTCSLASLEAKDE